MVIDIAVASWSRVHTRSTRAALPGLA
jgi:hypothetical protein